MAISVYRFYLDSSGWHFVTPGGVISFWGESANNCIFAAVNYGKKKGWSKIEICQYLEYLYNEGEI